MRPMNLNTSSKIQNALPAWPIYIYLATTRLRIFLNRGGGVLARVYTKAKMYACGIPVSFGLE